MKSMLSLSVACGLVIALPAPWILIAQTPVAVGDDFQVNIYTTAVQNDPEIAVGPSGDFVIVWENSNQISVQARLFSSDGSALGDELLVSSYTTGIQLVPAVARSAEGFVVTWAGLPSEDEAEIHGQRFTSEGQAAGGPFVVNTYTPELQYGPAVSMGEAGDFVVAWFTNDVYFDIRARLFASDGTPMGPDFLVNIYTTSDQSFPAVERLNQDGDFVVVWESEELVTGQGINVRGRLFSSDGTAIGSDFVVNSYTTGFQQRPDVAADGTGGFFVVWQSSESLGTDTSEGSIQGRRFASDGGALGSDFQINAWTTWNQTDVKILGTSSGDFTVVWHNNDADLGHRSSIRSRTLDSSGAFVGAEFQVNTYTTGRQLQPAVAAAPSGDFVVTWGSEGSTGTDADYFSVQARRFRVTGDIGDRVWLDNGDGIQSAGEDGVENVTVHLYDSEATLLESTVTDASGLYAFTRSPGDYYLEFVLPEGMAFAPQDQGDDDSLDSDVSTTTGTTSVFTLNTGLVDASRDAGLEPAEIGNRVWHDFNADGLQQPEEVGLDGVTVRLLRQNGAEIATTTTSADGLYGFADIASGTYLIEVVPPTGAVFSDQDLGGDDLIDSDVDPVTGRTEPIEYDAGTASRSWDAGFQLLPFFADGFESGDTSAWSSTTP